MATNTKRGPVEFRMETRSALLVFGLCGAAGVLLDVDHAISILLWHFWFPSITEGRIWHTPVFIACGLALCYLVSHCTRLYIRLVLITIILATAAITVFSPLVVWSW